MFVDNNLCLLKHYYNDSKFVSMGDKNGHNFLSESNHMKQNFFWVSLVLKQRGYEVSILILVLYAIRSQFPIALIH